jgi:hypothetical protein
MSPRGHTFVTAQPHAHVRFRRAIERRALWMAEDAARELPNLPLEDALQLVHLYAERGSLKYEKAAVRWLERYVPDYARLWPVVPRGENSSQVADPRITPRTNLHPPSASGGNMYLQWSHRTSGVGADL